MIFNEKFGVVILHYKTISETIACVESVKKRFESVEFKIVIVDNYSNNQTGEMLLSNYCDDKDVEVIINDENLGFARGLNCGIDFLRNTFYPDFYILLNNDVELMSCNWEETIIRKYKEYNFSVMGPDIITLEDFHCSPVKPQITNLKDVKKLIRKKRKELLFQYLFISPLIDVVKSIAKKTINYKSATSFEYLNEQVNVQLQGSCLILSRTFFDYYDRLFDKTFLYFEEAILKYMCDYHGLVSLYSPELKLLHKECVATKQSNKSKRSKQIFYLKHSLNSCMSFLDNIKNFLERPLFEKTENGSK